MLFLTNQIFSPLQAVVWVMMPESVSFFLGGGCLYDGDVAFVFQNALPSEWVCSLCPWCKTTLPSVWSAAWAFPLCLFPHTLLNVKWSPFVHNFEFYRMQYSLFGMFKSFWPCLSHKLLFLVLNCQLPFTYFGQYQRTMINTHLAI